MIKPVTFEAKVLAKEQITKDVIKLTLETPQEFTFKAGQFITLRITKENITKPRSYSILSNPSQKGTIELCIKIVDDGFASQVFEKTNIGDVFPAVGPLGHFTFHQDNQTHDHWFIGAGTGIAPLYSMIKEHLQTHSEQTFKLIMGYKAKQDILFHQELEDLELNNINFEYVPTLSRDEWHGAVGRVQAHLGEDFSNKIFYICGLKEMVLETKELLSAAGVRAQNIHFERYS